MTIPLEKSKTQKGTGRETYLLELLLLKKKDLQYPPYFYKGHDQVLPHDIVTLKAFENLKDFLEMDLSQLSKTCHCSWFQWKEKNKCDL